MAGGNRSHKIIIVKPTTLTHEISYSLSIWQKLPSSNLDMSPLPLPTLQNKYVHKKIYFPKIKTDLILQGPQKGC